MGWDLDRPRVCHHLGRMSSIPIQFANVTALTKANVYFDGQVVSHSLLFPDGRKKTLGLIFEGSYFFETGVAEEMEIVSGACSVKIKGTENTQSYKAGDSFEIPANSGFDINVASGICEYICTFVDKK